MTLAERIIAAVKQREAFGLAKHGRPLQPWKDKRDWLKEAYEEALDILFYLEAAIQKRECFTRYKNSPTRNKTVARYNTGSAGKAAQARYRKTEKSRQRQQKYDKSDKGRARDKRYYSTPARREKNLWQHRSWRKAEKIKNATL